MASIKDFTDAMANLGVMPSAANMYDLVVANEEGLRLGIFGDREGACSPHNHSSRGGQRLSRSFTSMGLGPYVRPGSGATSIVGVPVYPPIAGVDFGATSYPAGAYYKLVHHQGVYVPGGCSALRVRLGINFIGAGSRTLRLMCVLRPLEKMGLAYEGSGIPNVSASQTFSTTGANNFINGDILLAPLGRFGDVNVGRWLELLVVLVNNPTVGTAPRLLGVNVYPLITNTLPPPLPIGLPFVKIDTREIQQGAWVTEKLFAQVKSMFDGFILATLGKIPGKVVDWQQGGGQAFENKQEPYRQPITDLSTSKGIHQHTGSTFGDGALIPAQLVSFAPVDDMSDTAGLEMNYFPVKGALIDPSGVGSATPNSLRIFRHRVPVARGDTKLLVKVAVAPVIDDAEGFLYMLVRSRQILKADAEAPVQSINLADPAITYINTEIIESVEMGADTTQSINGKVSDFWQILLKPEDCDIYKSNGNRAGSGLLGNWTEAAMLPDALMPDGWLSNVFQAGGYRTYRTSKTVALNINPRGRTGDVMFDFRFYMVNQAGTVKSSPRLQWLAVVRPEQL